MGTPKSTLKSYLSSGWVEPGDQRTTLVNPATEAELAEVGVPATDLAATVDHARQVGGPSLAALSFAQRGELLRAMSRLIHTQRDDLIELAIANGGNTRGDAKFDIDGGSATLAAYADLSKELGDHQILVEGEGIQLGRSARFHGIHAWVARTGVAVHINAFNFPVWGFAEKAAVALLAGMPVITKPASSTALVAHRLIELMVGDKLVPNGALSMIAGGVGDLLTHLCGQDVLAFTGSGDTGAKLRLMPNLARGSVRINVEADSLNAAVLGPDAGRGTSPYEMFLADIVKEMTQKTGQKCTATRRIMVPAEHIDAVIEDLSERLAAVRVGDPALKEVTMGPLSSRRQLEDVRAGIARLSAEATSVFGGDGAVEAIGVDKGKGFFVGPVLFRANDALAATAVHAHEVFGPVATLLEYDGSAATAIELVRRGGGGLVSSVYADDPDFLRQTALGIAAYHGRVNLASGKLAGQSTPPGLVLPQLVHGGPGRAGGGEELGGTRGMAFYMQRLALQGDRAILQRAFQGPTPSGR